MYQVTLINLTADARRADSDLGASPPRSCSAAELTALLEAFRGIDPLHDVEPEPEIRVERGGERSIVTVTQGRLLVADARDRSRPQLGRSVTEILADLDGSASALRPATPPQVPTQSGGAVNTRATVAIAVRSTHRARVIVLSAAAMALLAGIVFLSLPRGGDHPLPFVPLTPAERAETARLVAGVYVTGGAPGDRGIVVGGDGTIRVFELNAAGAPSFVHGTWRAGRSEGALCLSIPELGTVVKIVDRETVDYCGERYRRAATS